jgi:hypothetical protein
MNNTEFNKLKKELLDECQSIMDAKQPEYTNKNIDVLYNFKSTGNHIGIKPAEVWAVFFHKHIQAILSHANNPDMPQAEPIESRYADAINYLFLGYALMNDKPKKDIISGTE